VIADVGPSSSSKKRATVRALTGMLQITQDPETAQVLTAMAMMNMEGEGISDANAYFRKKLLRMGVVKPTDAEAEELMAEMQGQQQDPNAMYLQAAAEEATAKAAKARADTVETIAAQNSNAPRRSRPSARPATWILRTRADHNGRAIGSNHGETDAACCQ
jgi:hypothetical protein